MRRIPVSLLNDCGNYTYHLNLIPLSTSRNTTDCSLSVRYLKFSFGSYSHLVSHLAVRVQIKVTLSLYTALWCMGDSSKAPLILNLGTRRS